MIDFFVDIFRESVQETFVGHLRWVMVALAAEVMFGLRFLVQWITSERKGKSCLPLSFWFLSILGSILAFIYAVHIRNFMVMLAVGLPLLIYVRNIQLQRRNK